MATKNSKTVSATAEALSRASSRDPKQASRYYHEVLREAVDLVKSAEAQRRR